MAKYSWHEDYWYREPPSPDQRVPSIPPRPLAAVPLLPRRPQPTRFEWWLPAFLVVVGLLAYAYGMWRVS